MGFLNVLSSRLYVSMILVLLASILCPSCLMFASVKADSSADWLSGWQYRKSHLIDSQSGAGTNYQTGIKVYYGSGTDGTETVTGIQMGRVYCNGLCGTDFGDIRFTDNDEITLLDYWIQEKTDSDSAIFWVEIADDLNSSPATIYMYYGNQNVTTTSSGDNAFILFDQFEGSSLDTNKWIVRQGDVAVSAGELILAGTGGTRGLADSLASFSIGKALHTRVRWGSSSIGTNHFCSMRKSNDWSYRGGDAYGSASSTFCYETTNAGIPTETLNVNVATPTNYHIYRVAWKPGQSTVYQDETQKAQHTTNIPSTDQVVVFYEGSTAGVNAYVDWCFVRKWVDPEPGHGGWGTQEIMSTRLFINPPLISKTSADVGTKFKINVTLQNVADLWAFDFNITWNDDLMTLSSVDMTALDSIWGFGNWFVAVNRTGFGWYKLAVVSTSTGFSSTGINVLAVLEYRVEGPICNSMRESYFHFVTHKLSDSKPSPITHTAEDGRYQISGQTPTLLLIPGVAVCSKYGECFSIRIDISDACNVEDFEFEIQYNATLLKYSNVTWQAWGSGTVITDETNGKVTGYTSSSSRVKGNKTLVGIEFQSAYRHIWKDLATIADWENDLSERIFIQSANLSYQGASDLEYVRDGIKQINVGPDATYTFSPIQGDINNDGNVDIFDLRTIAAYYDVKEGDPLWAEASRYEITKPTSESIIDIHDLVVGAANFGYEYDC